MAELVLKEPESGHVSGPLTKQQKRQMSLAAKYSWNQHSNNTHNSVKGSHEMMPNKEEDKRIMVIASKLMSK